MMGAMEHDEVRDLLADAAIEPGGLDRLMAGDTPTAALVAGHLAGCPECTDELERLRRSVGIIRPMVRATPPPELRERTLAYVAALGRPRGATPAAELRPAASPIAPSPIGSDRRPWRVRRLPQLAALAAAIALTVTGTALVVNASHEDQARRQTAEIDALDDVARGMISVGAQPDVQRVALTSTDGSPTTGTLVFSPSSTELVVVAEKLTPAPAGHEYRCWVDVGGQRAPIGKMFFGGDLAYWVGKVSRVAGIGPGARFGVSLVELGASGPPGAPVLVSAG
jgi:anti-sigma-K factor RskA